MMEKAVTLFITMCLILVTSITVTAHTTNEYAISTTSETSPVNKNETYDISGHIKDKKGKALAGTFVIPSQNGELIGAGTYTDENGTYVLKELKTGKYHLIVVTIPIKKDTYSQAQGATEIQEITVKNKDMDAIDIVVTL